MRTSTTSSPKLRLRRDALRELTIAELTLAVAGTWAHQQIGRA
jgi:hypothetical protein